jgi:DNA replication and repair protein RecF
MITDIRLQHFRSYRDESFEFSPAVNIIVGPNASGKTNLLEAILVIARGTSYRTKDTELVQFKKPWARLDSHVPDGQRTVKIVVDPYLEKTYEIDTKEYKRLNLQNTLPLVLFEPNHLLLLNGSPEQRREYLDDLLEHIRPGYSSLRRQYKRTLAQRNSLLKKGFEAAKTQLFPWDLRLSELGGTIARSRSELVSDINRAIAPLYKDLSHTKVKVTTTYQPQFPVENYETSLLKKLEASALLDAQRGFTAAGPHREDFLVALDGKPSGETASRGEVRSCILALKIIEMGIIEQARGIQPILLLDDVFSELDGARRRALTEHLQSHQTFITTTDADVVVQHFAEHSNIIPIGKPTGG